MSSHPVAGRFVGLVLSVLFAGAPLAAAFGQEENPGLDRPGLVADPVPAEVRIQGVLVQPTTVEFVATPLSEVAQFLGHRHGIPILFDQPALEDLGCGTDTPVTLNIHGVSLASVLSLVLEPLDLDWLIRNEVLLITSRDEVANLLKAKVYPLAELLKAMSGGQWGPDDLAEVLQRIIEPSSWDRAGGPGAMSSHGTMLIVAADRRVHAAIAQLLADLEHCYGLAQPAAPAANLAAIRRALAADSSFEFVDTPLVDVRDFLAEKYEIPILFDDRVLADLGIGGDTPLTLRLAHVRLEAALARLLDPLDLTWVIRHEVLFVTSQDEAGSLLTTAVYRVSDVLDRARAGEPPADSLVEAIASTIMPDSWSDTGGPGDLAMLPGVLIVSQTSSVHDQINRLLAQLRQAPAQPQEPPHESRDSQPIGGGDAPDGRLRLHIYGIWGVSGEDLVNAIPQSIAPLTWSTSGGEGSICLVRGDPAAVVLPAGSVQPPGGSAAGLPGAVPVYLVVRQTDDVHRQIAKLLRDLGAGGMGGYRGDGAFGTQDSR